ncbi:MAG: preprotein translocase subunit SecE [Desulfovibrionaceae bacterium]|nr:preprotein translocase subunit SecE [Desulfovibrionaceae bacterium]
MAKKQVPPQATVETTPNVFQRFSTYVNDSRLELRKVTWPTLQETKKTAISVLAFVAVMAILLGLVDLGLSSLIKAVLS